MDSMLGYKNDRYLYFGRCAAKLDDAANYLPSRISGGLMVLAAYFSGFDGWNAWKIFRRDSRNHASPNSAQTESVMAGALDVQLAGNAYYFGKLYEKPTIGDPIRLIEQEDIRRANRLLYATAITGVVLVLFIRIVLILCWSGIQSLICNYSEDSIPRGVLACFLPKSRAIQGKMPSPKVIWNAF